MRLRAADVASFATTGLFAIALYIAGLRLSQWEFWFLLGAWVALGHFDAWATLTRERNRNVASRLKEARARRSRLFDQEA